MAKMFDAWFVWDRTQSWSTCFSVRRGSKGHIVPLLPNSRFGSANGGISSLRDHWVVATPCSRRADHVGGRSTSWRAGSSTMATLWALRSGRRRFRQYQGVRPNGSGKQSCWVIVVLSGQAGHGRVWEVGDGMYRASCLGGLHMLQFGGFAFAARWVLWICLTVVSQFFKQQLVLPRVHKELWICRFLGSTSPNLSPSFQLNASLIWQNVHHPRFLWGGGSLTHWRVAQSNWQGFEEVCVCPELFRDLLIRSHFHDWLRSVVVGECVLQGPCGSTGSTHPGTFVRLRPPQLHQRGTRGPEDLAPEGLKNREPPGVGWFSRVFTPYI